jgi:ABC-type amino acid transport substrate-binding protein
MSLQVLTIGLDEAAPLPLHTAYASTSFEGFEVDLLQKIAADLYLDISYTVAPWDKLLQMCHEGSIDAICSAVTVTADRKQRLAFSEPYLYLHLCSVCRKDHLLSLEQLHEHPVGVRRGTTAEEWLIDHLGLSPALRSDSNDDLYNQLLNGFIHAVIEDSPIAYGYTKAHPELTIVDIFPDSAAHYAIAFCKKDLASVEKINSALKQLKQGGSLHTLQEKWFGYEPL